MARPEEDRRPNSENGNIRLANPTGLMGDNPAALIVNRKSYERMAAHFFVDQFNYPQVVRVSIFSSEHGEVVREFILDGMTRTKFVVDNQEAITQEHPDFRFAVRDVTASALQNTTIVPVEERVEDRQTLTILQYLRAVVPPTVEHFQIAPHRIAALLIDGWGNMVGEDLSRRYSAITALSLLGNQRINIATDNGLRKDLARQPRIMVGETTDDRVRLQQALIEMAQIIRQARLNRQEVARSAFLLVSAESSVIGGKREARRQIYGLLHTPEVESKLDAAFPNISEREQMKNQLGQFITDSFKRANVTPNRNEIVGVLNEALRDPNLNFNNIIDVFTSQEPIKRCDEVREEMNRDRLAKNYMSTRKVAELNDVEKQLIARLGGRTRLYDADIQGLTRAIRTADTVLQRAEQFKTHVTSSRDELLASGASVQLLDEALPRIEAIQREVTTSTSLQEITRKNQELTDTINEVTRRINTQITIHRIGEIVDEFGGDKFKEGYGPQARTDIIGLVTGEFRQINDNNQTQIRQRVRELAGLDLDLVLRIKSGGITLKVALQRQREKYKPAQPIAPAAVPLINVETPRRDKLNILLDNIERGLNDVDLKPQEVTEAEKQRLDRVIRRLGQIDFGHPNTPYVMTELYPRLQEEVRKLREEATSAERERADRDVGLSFITKRKSLG